MRIDRIHRLRWIERAGKGRDIEEPCARNLQALLAFAGVTGYTYPFCTPYVLCDPWEVLFPSYNPMTELKIELTPATRLDVINVQQSIRECYGDVLDEYDRVLYCSHHTTGGYIDQGLAQRLNHRLDSIHTFLRTFQKLFPPGKSYQHDNMSLRTELTEEERENEPPNADSHLSFISSGLQSCVAYRNERDQPVYFVDLDGVNHKNQTRRRLSTIVGFNKDRLVDRFDLEVPASDQDIDSIDLKSEQVGLFEKSQDLIRQHGIEKGWIEFELDPNQPGAGLTVNEYETLLIQHDLASVLRNPMRYAVAGGQYLFRNPLAIPGKTWQYVKYDFIRMINRTLNVPGFSKLFTDRTVRRLFTAPASHFLGMKRSVRFLVACNGHPGGCGSILQGRYQSPILVQWKKALHGSRNVTATLRECM